MIVYHVKNTGRAAARRLFAENEKVFFDLEEAIKQYDAWAPPDGISRAMGINLRPGQRNIRSCGDVGAEFTVVETSGPECPDTVERKRLETEIRGVVDALIPSDCVVRMCEGGGPEDIAGSLAVSVAKLKDRVVKSP
jgi:hypothetical protein